jgi:hypothetical protein
VTVHMGELFCRAPVGGEICGVSGIISYLKRVLNMFSASLKRRGLYART